jgi:hypothetical protein
LQKYLQPPGQEKRLKKSGIQSATGESRQFKHKHNGSAMLTKKPFNDFAYVDIEKIGGSKGIKSSSKASIQEFFNGMTKTTSYDMNSSICSKAPSSLNGINNVPSAFASSLTGSIIEKITKPNTMRILKTHGCTTKEGSIGVNSVERKKGDIEPLDHIHLTTTANTEMVTRTASPGFDQKKKIISHKRVKSDITSISVPKDHAKIASIATSGKKFKKSGGTSGNAILGKEIMVVNMSNININSSNSKFSAERVITPTTQN